LTTAYMTLMIQWLGCCPNM